MPVPATPGTEGALVELFSSVQGEGVWIGCRQLFLRLAGCNLACAYCDTDFAAAATWRAEVAPGAGHFVEHANPATFAQLEATLAAWGPAALTWHHSLALTGGEPLLQADLLDAWLPRLRQRLPIYLETNGTLPQALEALLPVLDYVSMDIKLPSLTGEPFPLEAHRAFLQLARRRPCQVKIVLAPEVPVEELLAAAELVRQIAPEVPLILQPVTRDPAADWPPGGLLAVQQRVAQLHRDTRIVPQTHRFLGLL